MFYVFVLFFVYFLFCYFSFPVVSSFTLSVFIFLRKKEGTVNQAAWVRRGRAQTHRSLY